MTTYYPAPSGIYTQMVTTANTHLARNSGVVNVGPLPPAAASSDVKLNLNGVVKLAGLAADPVSGVEGSIYYNTTTRKFRAFEGNPAGWVDLIGANSGAGAPCGPDSDGVTMALNNSGHALKTTWCCSVRSPSYDSSLGNGYYSWLRCVPWSAPGQPTPPAPPY